MVGRAAALRLLLVVEKIESEQRIGWLLREALRAAVRHLLLLTIWIVGSSLARSEDQIAIPEGCREVVPDLGVLVVDLLVEVVALVADLVDTAALIVLACCVRAATLEVTEPAAVFVFPLTQLE